MRRGKEKEKNTAETIQPMRSFFFQLSKKKKKRKILFIHLKACKVLNIYMEIIIFFSYLSNFTGK